MESAAAVAQPGWRWLAEQSTSGLVQLSLISLLLAAALILLASGVSIYLSLGLQKALGISALRQAASALQCRHLRALVPAFRRTRGSGTCV